MKFRRREEFLTSNDKLLRSVVTYDIVLPADHPSSVNLDINEAAIQSERLHKELTYSPNGVSVNRNMFWKWCLPSHVAKQKRPHPLVRVFAMKKSDYDLGRCKRHCETMWLTGKLVCRVFTIAPGPRSETTVKFTMRVIS